MRTRWLSLVLWMGALTLVGCSDPNGGGTFADLDNATGDGDGDDESAGDGDGDVGGDGDRNTGDGDDEEAGDGDDDDDDDGCGSIEEEAEIKRGPVDIIWAIDSSGSMGDEFLNVMTNLANFADGLQKSGANAKVVMMHGFSELLDPVSSSAFGKDKSRYKYLLTGVDSWNAYGAINSNFDNYKSFLRPDAPTHIIVVSDDENRALVSGLETADFKAQMEAKLGHTFFFHAIVADGKNGCFGSAVGMNYLDLADQTMGQKLAICTSDWSGLFKKLESAVIESAPLPCDFEIPEPPKGEELDPSLVDVGFTADKKKESFPKAKDMEACGDKIGWFFDDNAAPTRIEFCPAACTKVKAGGKIGIAFGCEPPILL